MSKKAKIRPKEFGDRVKKIRDRNDWTQEKLAEKSKLSRDVISKIERGQSHPYFETMAHISEGMQISLDYLAFGTDNKDEFEEAFETLPLGVQEVIREGVVKLAALFSEK